MPELGRRQRRRLETIEEILDVATEVMTQTGPAGLAIGEIARRMGIRPPSLYVYFDSKNAIYDALFARGWQRLLASMEQLGKRLDESPDGLAVVEALTEHVVRWVRAHRAEAQLMFWRSAPGFQPSATSNAQHGEFTHRVTLLFAELQRRGQLRGHVDVAKLNSTWQVVLAGLVSQELVADGDKPLVDQGAGVGDVMGMLAAHFRPAVNAERAITAAQEGFERR
jgi:AcrR family transcriptional regulator